MISTPKLCRLTSILIALFALGRDAKGADAPPANLFPIGVYWQPTSSFDLWKSRGVNTVIGFYNKPADMAAFNQAAVSKGLWMIRNPRANPADDLHQPNLLAWAHADEPDINRVPSATLAAEYAAWKAADPSRPVIVNFSGQNAQYQADGLTDAIYQQYSQSADWISNDVYPITAWNHPDWIDKNAKLNLRNPANNGGVPFNPGNSVDKLRAISGGKKQLAYIETSFQNIGKGPAKNARGATAAEVRGETWDAIIHGARGIVYFSQSFHPDKTDATPAAVATEITRTDAKITEMAAVLNSASDANSNPLSLGGGFEGTWREYGGKRYFFVLNFSHTAAKKAKITLTGIAGQSLIDVVDESRKLTLSYGAITDSFTPYQLHIYQAAMNAGFASTVHNSLISSSSLAVSSAVPEPLSMAGIVLSAVALIKRRRR